MDNENTLYLDLKDGRVVIELLPNVAPKHVARIKELVRQGFYDGVVFHRVIEGFMAQTGDPTGTGMGGSGQKLPAEFNAEPPGRVTPCVPLTSPMGKRCLMLTDSHQMVPANPPLLCWAQTAISRGSAERSMPCWR